MERLDLPAHGVPVELLDCFCTRLDREIGQQLSLDARTSGRHNALVHVDHRELQHRVAALLADGWQHRHVLVAKLKGHRHGCPFASRISTAFTIMSAVYRHEG